LENIIKKYNLELLVTFGSFQTNRFQKQSDLDIGYISKRNLTMDEKISLLSALVFYFQKDNIDLVNLKKASPLLAYEVACNGRILFETKNRFLLFKIQASARYIDTKRLREARKNFLADQLVQLEKMRSGGDDYAGD